MRGWRHSSREFEEEGRRNGAAARNEADAAVQLSHLIIVAGALFALLLTLFVLQSIRRPLGRLSLAMRKLIEGRLDIALPPEGHGELGRMATTLRLLRDSLIERDRLQREQATAEAARKDAQQRLMEALETIPDGFVLYGPDDRLVLCNSRYRYLYADLPIDLQPGAPFADVIRAIAASGVVRDAVGREEDWVRERIARHHAAHGGYEHQRADGSWLRVTERRTFDGGVVAVYVEITELKRREAQLGEMVDRLADARDAALDATAAKSRFLANMSHELRTPLNAIIGITEMLREEAQELGEQDFLEPLERTTRAGRHLLALINDILDLSKVEAGRMELNIESFDVREMIEDALGMVQPMADKNTNRVVLDTPEPLGRMSSDMTRVRQIVFNLLSNACKFTENGTVTVHCRSGDDWIEVEVTDTGIGMTEEQQARLFQEFSQADASTTRKYGGTGLGLAISQRFAEIMGGRITARSAPGEGSVFTLHLPRTVPSTAPESRATAGEAAPPSGPVEGMVLVVDDDADARDLLERMFRREGYSVATAANGVEGLARARSLQPALITLDVRMPDLDGWTVLERLKADPALEDVPVLMISVVDDVQRGLTLGALDHATKPIDRARLVALLRKHGLKRDSGRVLVVEDEAATRYMMRRILGSEGCRVDEAENGRQGLEQVSAQRPDLILLDLMMPEMDGFEFLTALRANRDWASIPVIVVTAADLTKDDVRRLSGGVEHIVRKAGRGPDEFLAEMRALVSRCLPAMAAGSRQ